VRGTEQTAVYIDNYLGSDAQIEGAAAWITIAASNVLPEVLMRQASTLITHKGLNIVRANLDLVNDPSTHIPGVVATGNVSMLRLLVTAPSGQQDTAVEELKGSLQTQLIRMKWLDEEVIQMGTNRHPYLGIDKAEVLVALCSMLHGPLTKLNPAHSSIKNIVAMLESSVHFMTISEEVAELFLLRFKPTTKDSQTGRWKGALDDAAFNSKLAALEKKIKVIHSEGPRVLLLKMIHAVRDIKRTNFYNKDRYSLSFRIDPSVMVPPDSGKPMPYGVFFVHGRNFNAFHCRFRDIARGGLRIVTPRNNDEYILSSSLQFDEVYGLSFAQQLKNKDIPEVRGQYFVVLQNVDKPC
jgi:glutamate dehydrogenase